MAGKKVNLFLDEDLIKEGKKLAVDEETSLSQIVSNLLRDYIQRKKLEKAKK